MMQLYLNNRNEPVIRYEVKGDRCDYIHQLKAMVVALSQIKDDNPLNNDARETLTGMLLDMLPDLQHIK